MRHRRPTGINPKKTQFGHSGNMCRFLRAGCRSQTPPENRAWNFGAEVYPRDWFLDASVAWATMSRYRSRTVRRSESQPGRTSSSRRLIRGQNPFPTRTALPDLPALSRRCPIWEGRVVLSRIANSLNLRLSALLDGGLGSAAFLGLNLRVLLRRDHREQIINLFPNRLR